jgi:N-methylhydantoinase B
MKIDPVTLEIIRNALPAIANEMSYDLQRTSYNMMIYGVLPVSMRSQFFPSEEA